MMNMFDNFFNERTLPLNKKFSGMYRAVVVDTNDPFRMHRVKFKMPEMHDADLDDSLCPWAVPSFDFGTKGCGKWSYPCIGDYIWVQFEKNHAYGPVYTGFADPTRRRFYALPSLYGETPRPVDINSDLVDHLQDYQIDYMPKDGRPMSYGNQDRYGNLDIISAVGFFPIEHDIDPVPEASDSLCSIDYEQKLSRPIANDPDSKFMLRMTKYGNMLLQSDVGYDWRNDGDNGEFTGDFDEDAQYEIDRWHYMQRLIHEDSPSDRDQRRIQIATRYGHKFEMRDVGWNKTRDGEFGDSKTIGDGDDQRWIKLRTKGGNLIELIDIGSDSEQDEFVSRNLIQEVSLFEQLDGEDKFIDSSGNKDARMVRFITRSGIKFVLDDRGSHNTSAQSENLSNDEIGIGVLIKGRATPGTKNDYSSKSGDPTGFFWQIDERPSSNSTIWGTPRGQAIELNDNEERLTLCSAIPDMPTKWEYVYNNEFLESSTVKFDPLHNTHHLVIDHASEAIRFKTRSGNGIGSELKKLGDSAEGINAGLEVHDAPSGNPWVELVDHDDRGIYMSRSNGITAMRAKDGKEMAIWLDDNNDSIVLYNGDGKIQIVSNNSIEFISDNISFKCDNFNVNSKKSIIKAGSGSFVFNSSGFGTSGDIDAKNVRAFFPSVPIPEHIVGQGVGSASPKSGRVSNLNKAEIPVIKPDNRL